jgi:hypothetical protein
MSEYMGITCRYPTGCNDNASQLIIYGCYSDHIEEIAVCGPCSQIWRYLHEDSRTFCYTCHMLVAEYEMIPLAHATREYRLEYIHGTTTPNTRHPYAPKLRS